MVSPVSKILPVIIGMVLTGILLAGLAYISSVRKTAPARIVPALTILEPAPGGAVDSPLVIRFVSSAPIALRHSGWGAGQLHLHARVNDIDYMPAARELTRRDSVYTWLLPTVPRGNIAVQLGWADQAHRAVPGSATPPMRATLR